MPIAPLPNYTTEANSFQQIAQRHLGSVRRFVVPEPPLIASVSFIACRPPPVSSSAIANPSMCATPAIEDA
jgi:hypothetical protein